VAAAGTAGGVAVAVVNIAGIDELQSLGEPDSARSRQRLGRRGRDVQHLVIGMKRGEMQRHIDAQVVPYPGAFGGDLRVAVVLPRNEQRGDLYPYLGFVP